MIRDYIDDIEGEPESGELLKSLYKLVDDFGADQGRPKPHFSAIAMIVSELPAARFPLS